MMPSGRKSECFRKFKISCKNLAKKLEELSANELVEFGFDIVIHSAANAYVGESYQKPDLYLGRNVPATSKLLAALDLRKQKNHIFINMCLWYKV